MYKKILFLIVGALVFSGCGHGGSSGTTTLKGGVIKSIDGGETYAPAVKAGEKDISGVSVLSLTMDPADNRTLYIGSAKDGLFVTHNAGEKWEQMEFPPTKIYGMVVNAEDNNILYAAGVYDSRTRVYKSTDRGENWKEIYLEPKGGSVVLSLAINPRDPNHLMVGTSEGLIIQTKNGGATWQNVYTVEGSVREMHFDPFDSNNIFIFLHEKDVILSRDGGATFNTITVAKAVDEDEDDVRQVSGKIYSLTLDTKNRGTVYIGTNEGVFKGTNYGETWKSLNVIESVKGTPIYDVAVSPHDPSEVLFNVGSGIYRSTDAGETWHVYRLDAGANVKTVVYDNQEYGVIYLGLD